MHISVECDIHVEADVEKVMGDRAFWTHGATEWWRLIDPYTPMQTGNMSRNVTIEAEHGGGIIEYDAPYAHYQHTGLLMVDPVTRSSYARKGAKKVMTGKSLNYYKGKHAKAINQWDKEAEKTQKPLLIASMQDYINRGGLHLG